MDTSSYPQASPSRKGSLPLRNLKSTCTRADAFMWEQWLNKLPGRVRTSLIFVIILKMQMDMSWNWRSQMWKGLNIYDTNFHPPRLPMNFYLIQASSISDFSWFWLKGRESLVLTQWLETRFVSPSHSFQVTLLGSSFQGERKHHHVGSSSQEKPKL